MLIFFVTPDAMNYFYFQTGVSYHMARTSFGFTPERGENAASFAARLLQASTKPDAFVIEHQLTSEKLPVDFDGWEMAEEIRRQSGKHCFILTRDKEETDPRFIHYPETEEGRIALAKLIEAPLPAYDRLK